MATKYLDSNGLLYVWKKLKDSFAKKEELETVKGLIPKNVADLLDSGDYAKVSSIPKRLDSFLDVVDYAKKAEVPHNVDELNGIQDYAKVNSIPRRVSELEDFSDYVRKVELTNEVKTIIGNKGALEFSVVSTLPESGEKATIYLLSNDKGENDAYDEYIYVNGKFEKIGTTSVDLSGYLKANEISPVTNEEIDSLFQ